MSSSLRAASVSSSDWMLLSEFLCPNLSSSSHSVNIDPIKDDDTKGTSEAWTSSDDGPHHAVFTTDYAVTANESMFQTMSHDFVYEPIQISILDQAFQSVWSTDCPTQFTSFEEPPILTADVGIQTMATSISWLPIAGHRPTIPRCLKPDTPSPLTVHNGTVDQGYNSKKRKFADCTAWEDSISPPKKKAALENQDYGYLNNLFDYLKSPSITDGYAVIDEEEVIKPPILCNYEGSLNLKYIYVFS